MHVAFTTGHPRKFPSISKTISEVFLQRIRVMTPDSENLKMRLRQNPGHLIERNVPRTVDKYPSALLRHGA